MEKSKLTKLIDSLKQLDSNSNLPYEIANLNNALAAKIYGGNPPIDTGCTNFNCNNPLCDSLSATNNTSCYNTACHTQGQNNTSCTNSQCNNGSE